MKPMHLHKDGDVAVAGRFALANPAVLPSRFGRKDAEGDLRELKLAMKNQKTAMEEAHLSLKATVEQITKDAKSASEVGEAAKAAVEKAAEAAGVQAQKFADLEQEFAKFRDLLDQKRAAQKSLGAQFCETDDAKTLFEKKRGSASLHVKSITEATTGTGDAGNLIRADRVPGVITDPNRPMFLRQLLGAGQTTSNAIEFVRETGFTNAAAPVAEGALKPESDIQFELDSAPVRTIAHWIMASMQVLDDVPMLMSYIDSRLRYGLELEEEEQLLSGDGTGQNILGLIPQATAYDDSRGIPGDTRIDVLRRAMTQVRVAEYQADSIVIHPNDWESIELTKTADGAYVWAQPTAIAAARLWGLPVITSTALTEGEFLVGNFLQAATVWDRMLARVDVAREDGDNFRTNMVTIRAENRLALTVFRPEAIVYGNFTDVVSTGV